MDIEAAAELIWQSAKCGEYYARVLRRRHDVACGEFREATFEGLGGCIVKYV